MARTRLQELIDRAGPFASVYFDSTSDSEESARRLDLRCRALREKLSALGASERMLSALAIAFAAGPPEPERCGRALITDTATVLVDESLPEPPASEIVRVSPLPCLLPLIEGRGPQAPHVVAVVNQVGADLRGVNGHGDTFTRAVCGIGHPVHRLRGDDRRRAAPRRTRDVLRRNMDSVAREVSELADRVGAVTVMLAGESAVRASVHAALDNPCRDNAGDTDTSGVHHRRIVELDASGRDPNNGDLSIQIDKIVTETAELWRGELLTRYRDLGRTGEGTTSGLPDTAAALREASVAQLFVDSAALDDRQILVGADPTQVSTSAHDLSGPTGVRRADEAVPAAAIAGGSDIVPVGGRLSLPDGVGALLRHP